jgi:hypothetical protein
MAAMAVLRVLGVVAAAAAMSAVAVVVGSVAEVRGRRKPAAYFNIRPEVPVEDLPVALAVSLFRAVPAAMLLVVEAVLAVDGRVPPLPAEAEAEAEARTVKSLVVREIPVLRDRPPLLML